MKTWGFLAIGILVLVGLPIIFLTLVKPQDNTKLTDNYAVETPGPTQKSTMETKTPPAMTIDKNKKYQAVLKTQKGDMTVELNASKTPITVNNFVTLAKAKFYDNTIFHRVMKGFMIQGGDPSGDGTGGPGYRFNDEAFDGNYTRGTVAMANAGPNTNGSQFFIMHEDSNTLPHDYVIFGKVTKGLDVLDAIANGEVTSNRGELSKPVNPVKITSIQILEQ